MVSVLWYSAELGSAERCQLLEVPGGHRLLGTVLLPVDGRPAELRYRVDTDAAWRTRTVNVFVGVEEDVRRLALKADGQGRWSVGGVPAPHLDGCVDVDLGWTPSTNTLPIRRLGPGPDAGEIVEITAAWVRFPTLGVEPARQSYERLAERRWRYRQGAYAADLTVDESGLVLRYDEWTAIAHSRPERLGSAR